MPIRQSNQNLVTGWSCNEPQRSVVSRPIFTKRVGLTFRSHPCYLITLLSDSFLISHDESIQEPIALSDCDRTLLCLRRMFAIVEQHATL